MPVTEIPPTAGDPAAPVRAAPVARADLPADLPYELQTPWFAQRRAFRLIVLLLILNIVAVTSITWGPITVRAIQESLAARKAAEAQAQAAAAQPAAAAAKAAADPAALAQRAALVQQGLALPAVPGRVVYTEDFVEAAKLVADGRAGYSVVRQAQSNSGTQLPHPPAVWDGTAELRSMTAALRKGTATGTLFLGERRTPGGASRLIWVYVTARRNRFNDHVNNGGQFVDAPIERQIFATVMDPAHPTEPGKALWEYQLEVPQSRDHAVRVVADPPSGAKPGVVRNSIDRPGDGLRLMAAAPDPADPTRLTIPYEVADRPGQIEVRLQDDDRLRVAVDRGLKAVGAFDRTRGTETWDPHSDEVKQKGKR